MKKSFIFILLSFAIIISNAYAQIINSKIHRKTFSDPKPPAAEVTNNSAEKQAEQPLTDIKITNQQEPVLSEEEKTLPATITPEQINEANNQLRNDLRDSLKNNSLRERVEFFNVNNYLDKKERSKQLFRKSNDYKLSIRKNKVKTSVDLRNNEQLNDFIFEKAGKLRNYQSTQK